MNIYASQLVKACATVMLIGHVYIFHTISDAFDLLLFVVNFLFTFLA